MKKETRYLLFLVLFLISTAYFIIQHNSYLTWDFEVYKLNAQYWAGNSNYFEPYRPPIASFLFFPLLVFPGPQYAFIILVSAFFAAALWLLSKELGYDPVLLYALSLSYFTLAMGLFHGTELLSLTFIILAAVLVSRGNPAAGALLALAGLTRYALLPIGILVLLLFSIKKIAQATAYYFAVVGAWFIFNLVAYGNMFASISDQYVQNMLLRYGEFSHPITLKPFTDALGALLVIGIIGMIAWIYLFIRLCMVKPRADHSMAGKSYRSKHRSERNLLVKIRDLKAFERIIHTLSAIKKTASRNTGMLFFIALSAFVVFEFFGLPFKHPRYLFILVLPSAVFGLWFIMQCNDRIFWRLKWLRRYASRSSKTIAIYSVIAIIFLANLGFAIAELNPVNYEDTAMHESVVVKLEESGLDRCQVISNRWIILRQLGLSAEPIPFKEQLEDYVRDGYVLVLYKGDADFEPIEGLVAGMPVLHDSRGYVILSNGQCAHPRGYSKFYSQKVKEYVGAKCDHGSTNVLCVRGQDLTPCNVLFSGAMKTACQIVNFD